MRSKVTIKRKLYKEFPKYYTKTLLGNFNTKLGRENIFGPTIGNESLRQDSNDNGDSKICHIKKSSCEGHDIPAKKHSK
jgi:hypothetical protein